MGAQIMDLPEGPVTIMFTDIEGSTSLRTSLGDAETDALFRQHDDLIRAEIEANKGQDQKAALGDGFLSVFVSTRRAVAAAIGIQRALDSFNLKRSGPPLRVRIGLNTGEVAWQDGQLSGEAVHAAARVCAAGSGGQILVSDVTRQLAGTVPDVTFHDTGEHQLKGFPQPWRLWEVVWVRETTQLPQQVFVGRQHEMATLRSNLASALEGRGNLVLVGGEPGVGKTTLVKQLIREAEQKGALAVFGRCYESEGTVPYSPFVEMLEQALAIMPPEIVREDMGEDAPEVARMVPELRRRFPDIDEPLDLPPEQQRRYFFNAVGSFIGRGAARFPLMLVMDDIHWADEPTLLLIEHMAQLLPELRVLCVGTYRDVELDVSRPLAATLERMIRARIVDRIPVKRFDRDGVATMIEALAGKTAPDPIVAAVFEETEGNPFFVEEVFRHLVEEGKVFDESGDFRTDIEVDELDVPESVRLVVGRRLGRLGAESQKALAAGAVVGRGFPFSLLEEITEMDTGRLLDAVEEAEHARVIVPEERDGEVHYSFAHELIRQTLLSGLSLLRRQRLHLAVANAIERTDKKARDERPSEIAHHLLQAGAAAETERTLEYLELTADRAIEAAAFEDALRAIDDALSIVDPSDRLAWAKVRERSGWANRALGRFEECLAIWGEVVDVYKDHGDVEAALPLLREMAYQLLWLGRFDDVFAMNQRALDILGDRDVVDRSYFVGGIGALLGVGGFTDAAEERLAAARETAEAFSDDRVIGWVDWARTITFYASTRLPQAIESGRSSLQLLDSSGDVWTWCDTAGWASLALLFSGKISEAGELAVRGDELATRLGHLGAQILLRRTRAIADAMEHGDLDALERDVNADLALCHQINSPWVSHSHSWLGAIWQLRGRVEDALVQIEEGKRVEPPSAFSGVALGFQLLNRAYAGATDEVSSLLDEALPSIRPDAPTTMGSCILTLAFAQATAILGMAESAAQIYDRVLEIGDVFKTNWLDAASSARVAGMTAATMRRFDEAEAHHQAALAEIDGSPNRLDAPHIRYWYARMLLDRGGASDRGRAAELLPPSIEDYERMGMQMHTGWAKDLLAKL
jgi:class 3 adenylate cyclase/tetratricopeptide (TPR) repeat protein